jgi:hypothetical protein
MKVHEIQAGSELFAMLRDALNDPDTYKISLADDGGIKVKINESVWTPPLSAEKKG